MRITYCDLCGAPIQKRIYRLIECDYVENKTVNLDAEAQDFIDKTAGWNELEHEVCSTCKDIIRQIFKKRMIGMIKLAADLKTIYEIPVKEEAKLPKKKTDK